MAGLPPGNDYDDESGASGGLVAKTRAGDNAEPLTITEISSLLKRTVEDRFGYVRLRGELSGVKRAASGHLYCALKDEKAVLDGVMWRGNTQRLSFLPEDGLEVIATGKLTTYPGRSKYQIVIDSLELAGEGALLALLEKTRQRLEKEGLFARERKKPLPFLPRTIGVVTSPTGAVIRDILHRLADRFPTHVVVWPVLVQGQGAAEQVAAAVRGFSALTDGGPVPRPDLVIVARGGGSIEDLWSFNEEVVVRAIAECTIPVISAVGHETDTSLADFAADRRAPTPTAAAEMAVPVRAELSATLDDFALRKKRAIQRPVSLGRERLQTRAERLPRPDALLQPQSQRLDELAERLRRGLTDRAARGRERLNAARLSPAMLERSVREGRQRFSAQRLQPGLLTRALADRQQKLAAVTRVMHSLDPDNVLARGYVRVTGADGTTLTSKDAAVAESTLALHFRDGVLDVTPSGDSGSPPPAPKRKPTPQPSRRKRIEPPADTRQDDLFG